MGVVQVVIGPPGVGKSTYCVAMKQHLTALGRKVVLVNLDPANDTPLAMSGEATATAATASATSATSTKDDEALAFDIDIRELVQCDEVMERLELGPNGALVFCMEFIESNMEWLKEKMDVTEGAYFIVDCPGQVELYTHNTVMRHITHVMQDQWHHRLCCVHLLDSFMCSNAGNFVAGLLVSLSTMMQLELPHVNVLSKIDLVEAYGKLQFNLDFYTDVLDLSYLLDRLEEDTFTTRFKALNAALCELVEDFSLVHFHTLSVKDPPLIAKLQQAIDKATGFLYTTKVDGDVPLSQAVFPADTAEDDVSYAQSKYFQRDTRH
eukprot:m.45558 g.45558  ORF g.45558 m.45558 type:complete len:322 (+) comp10887_c0_seq1:1115-2080(+)